MEMNSTTNRIDLLSKQLQSLMPMKAEDLQRLDKKFRLEFNYNSNHIEGNTLTYGETALLLFFDDTKGNHTFREYEEMKAHDVAFEKIKDWAGENEYPLTEARIKNLNEIILVRPFWKEAVTGDGQNTRRLINIGDYKKFPNSVRLQNGEMFAYASPTDTPVLMGELMEWYRSEEEKKQLHPLQLAALFHYKFVRIHPFDDGNGRISRLLMNYVLLRNNLPPVIIKSSDKKNYLQALHLADTGNVNAFIDYIAEQLIWSLELSIKAANSESVEEEGDLDKKISLLGKQANQLQQTKTSPAYSNETYNAVIKGSIIPILNKWKEVLAKFNTLITDKLFTLTFNNNVQTTNDLSENYLTKLFNDYFIYEPDMEKSLSLTVDCNIRGLNNIHKDPDINAGEIIVEFHHNFYAVKHGDFSVDKQYNQQFTALEIEKMISATGNSLLTKIEDIYKNR